MWPQPSRGTRYSGSSSESCAGASWPSPWSRRRSLTQSRMADGWYAGRLAHGPGHSARRSRESAAGSWRGCIPRRAVALGCELEQPPVTKTALSRKLSDPLATTAASTGCPSLADPGATNGPPAERQSMSPRRLGAWRETRCFTWNMCTSVERARAPRLQLSDPAATTPHPRAPRRQSPFHVKHRGGRAPP